MALDITMLGILAVLAVCQQAGRSKREIATLKGVEQVGFPQLRLAVLIQKLLSGELVMLVNKVRFDGGVVRVFRAYMLEGKFIGLVTDGDIRRMLARGAESVIGMMI